jgi:AcrR family transcriptional regulator
VPRPTNPDLRKAVLAKVLDYLYAHGLAEVSLRRCGAAIGVSARMLVYYFGDKDTMVAEAIRSARPPVADLFAGADTPQRLRATLTDAYRQFASDHNRQPAALLLQTMALALTDPNRYGQFAREAITAWITPLTTAFQRLGWHPDDAAGRATAVISGLRGVALDAFLTANSARTQHAADDILAAIVTAPPPPASTAPTTRAARPS